MSNLSVNSSNQKRESKSSEDIMEENVEPPNVDRSKLSVKEMGSSNESEDSKENLSLDQASKTSLVSKKSSSTSPKKRVSYRIDTNRKDSPEQIEKPEISQTRKDHWSTSKDTAFYNMHEDEESFHNNEKLKNLPTIRIESEENEINDANEENSTSNQPVEEESVEKYEQKASSSKTEKKSSSKSNKNISIKVQKEHQNFKSRLEGYSDESKENMRNSSSRSRESSKESQDEPVKKNIFFYTNEKGKTIYIEDKIPTDDYSQGEFKNYELDVQVGYWGLLKFSNIFDKLLMFIGVVSAIICGFALPFVIILLGKVVDILVEDAKLKSKKKYFNGTFYTYRDFIHIDLGWLLFKNIRIYAIIMVIVGLSTLCLCYIFVSTFSLAAEHQIFRIRSRFIKSIFRQEMGWFEMALSNGLVPKITSDLSKIKEGLGEKVPIFLYLVSSSVFGLTVAVLVGWQMTLIILSIVPFIMASYILIGKMHTSLNSSEINGYLGASKLAEEVFLNIRTVHAFNGQEKEINKYKQLLIPAKHTGILTGLTSGLSVAALWICIYTSYMLAFWYGIKSITRTYDLSRNETGKYTAETLVVVLFCVLISTLNICHASMYWTTFKSAKVSATSIYQIIDRVPKIGASLNEGLTPQYFNGKIEFRNVFFAYPNKPVKFLKNINFIIHPGETVGITGRSGTGKSTIMMLLLRFFDPNEGEILIDNINIKNLNLIWLRKQIGFLDQDIHLFNETIYNNIKIGRTEASDKQIGIASVEANSHNFIMSYPKKYNTMVEEGRTGLNLGQKLRISFARALVREGKILILDETFSSLDEESVKMIKKNLTKYKKGRTTIIISQRIAPIQDADKIIFLKHGRISEIGPHESLIEKRKGYFKFFISQEGGIENQALGARSSEIELTQSHEKFYVNERPTSRDSKAASPSYLGASASRNTTGTDNLLYASSQEVRFMNQIHICDLLSFMKPEKNIIFCGCIFSVLMGLTIPAYSLVFGEIIGVLSLQNVVEIEEKSLDYSLLFLVVGISTAFCAMLQTIIFAIAGEKLTMRLRIMVFSSLIDQPISFFDDPRNSVEDLTSRLETDAANVKVMMGSNLSSLCQAMTTLISSIVIAIYFQWRLGLVLGVLFPFILLASVIESRIIAGQLKSEKVVLEISNKIVLNGIDNIRMVHVLNIARNVYLKYYYTLLETYKGIDYKSNLRGLNFGFSQAMTPFTYGILIYYGSYLINDKLLKYNDLFKISECVILGSSMFGQAVAFAPEYQRAKLSAVRIMTILNYSKLRIPFSVNKQIANFEGNIIFQNVHFGYPQKIVKRILQDCSFNIEAGKTVALVGTSGCGKTTCTQLLLGFYTPNYGSIILDESFMRNLDINWIRFQIGMVNQQPVLMKCSVRDNIAYGDNSRYIAMEEIEEAAKKANIHKSILRLQKGYETIIGTKITNLNLEQKRKIAVARALIRNPKILILDETFCALDEMNEDSSTFDLIRKDRTCIIIARHLTSIKNMDEIIFLHKGRVIERGTHEELMELEGAYFKLYMVQTQGV